MAINQGGRWRAMATAMVLWVSLAAAAQPDPGEAEFALASERINARDFAAAVAPLRAAAEAGHPDATNEIGYFHLHGIGGIAKEPEEAHRWFALAVERGSAEGMLNLAHLYSIGSGVARDDALALHWLRRAAEAGLADAQVSLGGNYYSGQYVPQDRAEAYRWFRLAAEAGRADAQASLATLYFRGEGIARDVAEAARWFELAAEQGHTLAQFNMGVLLLGGEEVGDAIEPDAARAVIWLEKAANQGYGQAAFRLSEIYREGELVAADAQAALRWLEAAATAGHADAQYRLGKRFLDGEGVAADRWLARRWLGEASQQGHLLAGMALAQSEQDAEQLAAVPADEVSRTQRLAAEGDTAAQRELGLMYRDGRGIARDESEALLWLGKAADAGDHDAALDAATLHMAGGGKEVDPRVQSWLEQAARGGRGEAALRLARLRIDTARSARDYRAAHVRLRSLVDGEADRGAPHASDAAYWLGWMSLRGLGVRADPVEAARWFRRALADEGAPQFVRWADQHRFASQDHYYDPALALAWLMLASAAGDEAGRRRLDERTPETSPVDRALAASLVDAWNPSEQRP